MPRSKKHRSANRLTDDLQFEILVRLPVKSLIRFRCVSKKWYGLESNSFYRKRLPPMMSGLFYTTRTLDSNLGWKSNVEYLSILKGNEEINTGLTFLPPYRSLRIVDCCNGLLLCRLWGPDSVPPVYYICNPVTRRGTVLPNPRKEFHSLILAFDPCISRHYGVVRCHHNRRTENLELEIFSSRSSNWSETQIPWARDAGFLRYRQRVFLNGVLHILANRHHIVGIDLQTKSCRRIELPKTEVMVRRVCIGKSGGCLHCVIMFGSQIQVCFLEDYNSNEWIVKHSTNINSIIERQYVEETNPSSSVRPSDRFIVMAIHPDLDVIFLRSYAKLFTYHVSSCTLTEIYCLPERSLPYLYVFSPCLSDALDGVPDG